MKWHPMNKQYYENKGYTYTKMYNEFEVKVEDLSDNSHVLVDVQCDGCGEILKGIVWQSYKKYLKENNKYYCQRCSHILFRKNKLISTMCTGIGKYPIFINGVKSPQYSTWYGMLNRCYNENFHLKEPAYIGCIVCEEWHNFQNFAQWYDDNIYETEGKHAHLDKDILIKGNKIYSPETCCFVPQNINNLLTKSFNRRGLLPIGVTLQKGKHNASCRNGNGIRIHLGLYKTPELAFEAYKTYKENLIKELAEKYRELIPENVYNALINYKVEIID